MKRRSIGKHQMIWRDMGKPLLCQKSKSLIEHQRRPNLLPMLPRPFRQTLENYSMELQKLALKIFECMAKVLNIDVEAMRGLFGEGNQSIRMNYYPPCPQPDKVIGLSPHSDGPAALTILLQLNEVEGLQIRKDGRWVSIQPIPGAFTINNIGDIMEIVSNGIYRSIVHRAVVNATKERLSVAAFYSPANDRDVGPIPNLITAKNPKRFRNVGMADYWKGFLAAALDGKSYINVVRINENNDDCTS